MVVHDHVMVSDKDLDSAGVATYTSDVVDVTHKLVLEFHAKWTKTGGGALAGTIVTQKSIGGNLWFDLDTIVIGNSSSSSSKSYVDIGYSKFRTVTTLSSGTATIYEVGNSKGV